MNLDLLTKFFQGRASTDEAIQVINWIKSQRAGKDISFLFDDFDEKSFKAEVDSEGILNKIHDRINIEELIQSLEVSYQDHDAKISVKNRPSALNKKERIPKLRRLIVYSTILVFVTFFAYFFGSRIEGTENFTTDQVNIIKKKTDKGQKLIIQLSDGSKVTLNAATTIEYQENFNDSIRLITLSGEAFFEVRKDSLRPFVVKSGNLTTQALGTSFNVHYRPRINVNEVALVTGKVKVDLNNVSNNETVVLNPGQMANLDFTTDELIEREVDLSKIIAWKDGIIYFDAAGYEQIINTLENWYDVDIETIGQPKRTWKFSAKFENENLYTILNALKYSQNIEYEMKDKMVKIYF